MDKDFSEYLEQINKDVSKTNFEIEKTIYRYIIIGSAASIIFILNFYRNGFETRNFVDIFDFELILFTASLFLGLIGIFANMLSGEKKSQIITKALEIELEKEVLGEFNDENIAEYKSLLEKSQSNTTDLAKQFNIGFNIRNFFIMAGALTFSTSFLMSIYTIIRLN